jgi:peptidoglycan/LPS O-acetylase OafA/YrhL
MRGIAILMVLAVHSTMFFNMFNIKQLPFDFQYVLQSGKYGVALFFIVSAYSLFRSLDIRKEKRFKYYFIRRFFRIAPLYYIILIFLFYFTDGKLFYMQNGIYNISLFNLVSHLFFVNGFFTNNFNSIIGVEWTIFVEVLFYLILPVIFIFKKHLIKIFLFFLSVTIISSLVNKFYLSNELEKIQLYFSPLTWFVVFMFGILIYKYDNNYIKNIFIKNKNIILSLFLFSFLMFSYIKLPGNYLVFSILLAVFFMLNKYNKISLFNNNILKKIGELSFSIYLIHMPVFSFVSSSKYLEYDSEG